MLPQDPKARNAATPDNDPAPVKPEPPLPSDCCESGCEVCVYDLYAEEVRHYEAELARWRQRHPEAG